MNEIEKLNMIAEWQEQHKQLIEDLDNSKKRIAELEDKLEHRNCVDCSNHGSNIKLIKAKELIKDALDKIDCVEHSSWWDKAEKFLAEE